MAYEKELKARIVHKHDISDHWDLAENFVPKQGELIIYDDRTLKQNGDTLVTDQIVDTRVRYKIGDGVTTVSLLPFADKELVDAIDTLYGNDTNTLSIREIATAVLGDAEKNQNAFSNIVVDGQTTVTADNATDTLTLVSGSNVMITTDASNLITIAATDTTYNVATENVAGLVKSSTTGTTANRDYNVEVKSDGTMKVNVPWTDTNTSLDKATTSGNGNAVTDIDVNGHTITLKKEKTFLEAHPTITTQTDSTSTESPNHGGTFTAIDSIDRDNNGHVTKINTKTVTLPTITAEDLGLERAMRFLGNIAETLVDGSKTNPVTVGSESISPVAGDVVLSKGYEFVWTAAGEWEQLGQEGDFSVKTHIHTASYTPEGIISTPTITVDASDTTINSITDVGTLPSASLTDGGAILTGTISDGPNRTVTLSVSYTAPALTFDAGSLPTKSSNVTVLTGITSATSSQPTFTGTAATITTNAANS